MPPFTSPWASTPRERHYFNKPWEIHRKALGPYHYLTLVGLNELARVHYIVGDYAKASEVAVQAARGENDLALNLFPTVSEAQRR